MNSAAKSRESRPREGRLASCGTTKTALSTRRVRLLHLRHLTLAETTRSTVAIVVVAAGQAHPVGRLHLRLHVSPISRRHVVRRHVRHAGTTEVGGSKRQWRCAHLLLQLVLLELLLEQLLLLL